MKRTNTSFTFLITMIIGAGIIMGCASTGIQRSNQASTTMQTMDGFIKLVVVQLEATGTSLNEIVKPGQSDVRTAFDLYTVNVGKIEKLEKDFAKHADEMEVRGQAYLAAWQKDDDNYNSLKIQELSAQRRVELGEVYARIGRNSIGVKDAFKTYVLKTKEIQRYLSNDLTAKGIEAITPIAGKTVLDGENLNYSMKNIQMALEKAQAEMAQAGTSLDY